MRIRGLTTLVTLCFALLLTACGGGSGRQGTDLVVTAVGPTSAVLAGTNAVFEMTLANAGGNAASGVEVSLTPANPTSLTCVASGGAVCPTTLAAAMTVSLPPGSRLAFTVTSLVAIGATGNVGSTLSARYPEDTDSFNNTATALAAIIDTASNLVVSGVAPLGSVAGGGVAEFAMTVRNDGPGDATGLQIDNRVGSYLQLNSITCTATGGGTCPSVLGVSMTLERLPVGASLTFTASTTVGAGVNGTVANTLSVTSDSDVNRSDNSYTASVAVVTPRSGVGVTGTGPAGTLSAGSTAVFTMLVSNAGPDAATAVNITNNVGSNLAFTGITCTASPGAVCPAAPLGPVMSVASLPAGGTLTFAVSTVVTSSITGTVTNTLAVTSAEDTDRTDNSATAVGSVVTPKASLVVSGTAPAAQVAGGATATFTMTVGNSGPDAATNVRVVNTVGSNLSFTGATCTATGGAVCPANVSVVTDVGTLPVGGQLTFSVNAVVAAGTNGAISNTLQATASNDANPTGNTVVAVGQAFTPRSVLTITGSGPSNVQAGTDTSFVMTLSNTGPQAAETVRLVNTVGGNLTMTGITCSASGGAVCPVVGAAMDVTNLPVGGTLVFTVAARVAAGTQGTIVNTLDATVTSGIRSTASAVAVGSAFVAVTPRSALAVTGSAPAGQVLGGATANFLMTVANSGPDAATGVRIVNTVGSNLTFTGITCSASGGAVCPSTVGVVTEVPSLPMGGLLTFNVSALVAAGTNGAITNTLQASASNNTSTTGNSAVAVGQAFTPRSVLTVAGTAPSNVPAGTAASFTMVVTNTGPNVAETVRLVNTVGGNLTLTGMTCSASGGAVCPTTGTGMDVVNMPVNGVLSFTVNTFVAAGTNGAITNTLEAAVTSGIRSTASTVAVGSAYANNLVVSGSAPSGSLVGGAATSFVMTVSNSGPGAAQNVAISNVLGSGLSPGAAGIACTATGGAVCPASPAATMTVASLPANGTLTFSIPVVVNVGFNGTVTNTMSATALGDSRAADNSSTVSATAASVDVGVSQSAASLQLTAGSTAVFTALVSNPGPAAVNNLVLTHSLSGAAGTVANIVCSASNGATCPTTGPVMSVPVLAAGRTLTFTITVAVPSSARGAIVSAMALTADGDPNTGNNSAAATTTAIDPRSGTYKVFAADGSLHDVAVDFDAGSYTMDGSGQTPFIADTSGGGFSGSGGEKFRAATDLLVGLHRFGGSLVPYVAARSFGSAVNELAGEYNLATRDIAVDLSAVTRPGRAVVQGNDLYVCQLDGAVRPPGANCLSGSANVTSTFNLSVSGNQFTATPVGGGQPVALYLVRSGAAKLWLSGQTNADGTKRFRIALQDPPTLSGGTLLGASSTGDWVTLTLGASSYLVDGMAGATGQGSATLATLGAASGASALLSGTLNLPGSTLSGSTLYVMQSSPLAVAFGAFGGPASGLIQIAIP